MAIRAPTMPNDTDTAQSPGLPKPMAFTAWLSQFS